MILNGFSFSEFNWIAQISICYGESCLTPLASSPARAQKWPTAVVGIPAKFHKTEPFRCLFFSSVCSDRIRKKNGPASWRCPQCRESCQEGTRNEAGETSSRSMRTLCAPAFVLTPSWPRHKGLMGHSDTWLRMALCSVTLLL